MRYITCLVALITFPLFSQEREGCERLFSYNGSYACTEEFRDMYTKNLDLSESVDRESVDDYLDRYIDFRLRIEDAKAQGLHETRSYERDFTKYRDRLYENHLFEHPVLQEMLAEAWDRKQQLVKAHHIVVLAPPTATPEDRLRALDKITEIREQVMHSRGLPPGSVERFEQMAFNFSEDKGAKENRGQLGYFSVFRMVYPFEDMAYKTPVDSISPVFRTRHGYHILRVSAKKPRPADVTVAHIFTSKESRSPNEAREKIHEIYEKLQQGGDFAELAAEYSDDRRSAEKGGDLSRVGPERVNDAELSDAMFSLATPGDYTKPIETPYGWHIIRLVEKHTVETYEGAEDKLKTSLKGSDRYGIALEKINRELKKEYGFTKDRNALSFFKAFIPDSILNPQWPWSYDRDKPELQTPILTLAGEKSRYGDFVGYIKKNRKKIRGHTDMDGMLEALYRDFENKKVQEFYKKALERQNNPYAKVVSEYRNGLLIYEWLERNVWEPARADSIGLQKFFDKNISDFRPAGYTGTDDELFGEVEGRVITEYQNALEAQQMERLRSQYVVKLDKRAYRRVKRSIRRQ